MPRLTKKQKGFVKDYVNTGIGSLAVKKNYDVSNDETARVIASENLTKPNIQKAIADMLPDELLAEKHLALLNKQEVRLKNNNETGEIEVIPTGEIDVVAVSKGLDMAYKLKGQYEESRESTRPINLIIPIQLSQSFNIQKENVEEVLEQTN